MRCNLDGYTNSYSLKQPPLPISPRLALAHSPPLLPPGHQDRAGDEMIGSIGVGWHPFAGGRRQEYDVGKTMPALGAGIGYAVDNVTFLKPLLAHWDQMRPIG